MDRGRVKGVAAPRAHLLEEVVFQGRVQQRVRGEAVQREDGEGREGQVAGLAVGRVDAGQQQRALELQQGFVAGDDGGVFRPRQGAGPGKATREAAGMRKKG